MVSDGPASSPPRRESSPNSSEEWDATYASSTPPWDIGRPQACFLRLAQSGRLAGKVLDVGCGTGEHALMAASLGHEALGVDLSPLAVEAALGKATARRSSARFVVWDALRLPELGEQFDTVLDCGLFHVFDDERRARFERSLAGVVPAGGRYHMLCFSERQPGDWGPRRVSQDEIRSTFARAWLVEAIEPAVLEITFDPEGVQAWQVTLTRRPTG